MKEELISSAAGSIADFLTKINPPPKNLKIALNKFKAIINNNKELITSLGNFDEEVKRFYRDRVIHHLSNYIKEIGIASASTVLLLLAETYIDNNINMSDFLFKNNNNTDAQELNSFLVAKQMQEESLSNQSQSVINVTATSSPAATIFSANVSSSSAIPLSSVPINTSSVVPFVSTDFKPEEYFQAWIKEFNLGNIESLNRLRSLISNSGLTSEKIAKVINFLPARGNSLFLQALEDENLDLAEFLFDKGGDLSVAKPEDGINAIHMLAMTHAGSAGSYLERIELSENEANQKIAKVSSLLKKFQQQDPNKFNQLINAPRNYADATSRTGVPLLKVIAYGNDPRYIANMIAAWQQVGARITEDQLYGIWSRCIGNGNGKSEDYLNEIKRLFPDCFTIERLKKTNKYYQKYLNAFEAAINQGDYSTLNYFINIHQDCINTNADLKQCIINAHIEKILTNFTEELMTNYFNQYSLGRRDIKDILQEIKNKFTNFNENNKSLIQFNQKFSAVNTQFREALIEYLEKKLMPRISNNIKEVNADLNCLNSIKLVAKEFIDKLTCMRDKSVQIGNKLS